MEKWCELCNEVARAAQMRVSIRNVCLQVAVVLVAAAAAVDAENSSYQQMKKEKNTQQASKMHKYIIEMEIK